MTKCASLRCGKQTAAMSVVNWRRSDSVDNTWGSHRWQHAKS